MGQKQTSFVETSVVINNDNEIATINGALTLLDTSHIVSPWILRFRNSHSYFTGKETESQKG